MKILLAQEAATILRVPKARVYELVRQKKFPAVRIGRLVRIPEDELRRWIARGGETLPDPEDEPSVSEAQSLKYPRE